MSYKLDPKILSKLRAFAARRRKLIIVRGVCTAVAMLLATMMIVAFVDLIFVLPDEVRWGLSAVAYIAVLIAEWRTCLTLLAHAPGPRRLARLLEHAEPKLREDLLSAVELGTSNESEVVDSAQFRELVQSDVAARMDKVDVDRLLPVHLLRRYLAMAAAIFVAMVVAFILTGSGFGTLLMRALLPMANFARVSKFKVAIVEPKPAEMRVPFGDAVPLLIEVSGGRTSKAVLEVFTKSGGREKVEMTPAEGDRFSATIQVARENVEYRVRAGDAITRKYRLDATARPHIASFEKSYVYPAYSRVGTKRVTEENGDLAALEGSEVELRLTPNQKIKSGELHIEQGRKEVVVPLVAGEGNKLTAKISMQSSGTYRVHLVGAESGFENKFSPEYEIRAEPDLVPQVELDLPKDDLILPANEIVDLEGTATDDQSLAKVAQLVRVNEGPWREVPLAKDPGAKVKVERRWDLFEQGVKPGDLLTTKLLAVDLKGNKSESRSLQITITAAGFETKRLSALDAQRELLRAIGELRAAAETLEKQGVEARDLFARLPEADPQRKPAVLSATAALDALDAKTANAWNQLTATIRAASAGHQSADLVLLGRLLSRLDAGAADFARDALDLVTPDPGAAFARDQMREFADSASRAAQRARLVHDSYRMLVGAEELDVLTENVFVVAKEQERLGALAQKSGDDALKWAQIANRMRVVISETRSLEQLMTSTGEHLPPGYGDRIRRFAKEIEKQRTVIDTALTAGAPDKSLNDPTANLAKTCSAAARSLLDFKRELVNLPAQKAAEMVKEAQPTYTDFEKLRSDLQQVAASDKLPAEARARLNGRRWEERGELFKAHGDAEEARPDSDAYFVNDVRSVSLALKATHDAAITDAAQLNEKLTALDKDFRMLEGGHDLFEIADGLKQLANAERWEIHNPRARTTAPRDWSWLESRLRAIPGDLGKAPLDDAGRKLMGEVQKILWTILQQPFSQKVAEEMRQRFNPQRDPVAVQPEVEKIAAMVNQALNLLRKPMQEAREQLAQAVPKLPEMMAQLAKEAEELKKETQEEALKTAEKTPPEAQAETQKTLAKQEKLNGEVGALKDALRADANQQDVAKQEGRERARDADDALAMLKEPPVRAEQALLEAAQAPEANARKEALNGAAEHQQKLADALNQLAEHYAKVEQGKADESRTALRESERKNGVKEELDAQYAKAEQMAELGQKSPQELLAQLEKALSKNPAMQKELSEISKNTLGDAQKQLDQASHQENQVAQDLAKMAAGQTPPNAAPQTAQQAVANAQQAAKQALEKAQAAEKAADEAVQAAKAAGNPVAADQAREARADAKQGAESAQQAVQAATQMAQPNQAAEAAKAAAQKSGEAAQQAQQAGDAAAKAEATAKQTAAQQAGEQQAKNQQTSKEAGEAAAAAKEAATAAKAAQAAAQQVAAMSQAQNAQAAMAQQKAPTSPQAPQGGQPKEQLAQAASQQPQIAQAANQAGEQVERSGRHEERLQNMAAGEQLQQLGSEIKETAAQQVPTAQAALAKAQNAEQAKPAVNAADSQLAAEAGKLQAATNPQSEKGDHPEAQAQPPSPAAAQMAAQNPAGPAPAGSQAAASQPPSGQPQGSQAAQSAQATPPGQAQATPSQTGQTPATQASAQGQPPAGSTPNAPQAAPAQGSQPGGALPPGDLATAPATPQEQVWMARTLDALDAALHAGAAGKGESGAPENQPGQQPGQAQGEQPGQPGQPGQAGQDAASQAMAQAQTAMAAAAQAAAQAMRADRGEGADVPAGNAAKGDLMVKSKGGAKAGGTAVPYAQTAEARALKNGEWGKLPKKVAEELSQGQRESVAGEYRNQIETYYRVIAEKSKK